MKILRDWWFPLLIGLLVIGVVELIAWRAGESVSRHVQLIASLVGVHLGRPHGQAN